MYNRGFGHSIHNFHLFLCRSKFRIKGRAEAHCHLCVCPQPWHWSGHCITQVLAWHYNLSVTPVLRLPRTLTMTMCYYNQFCDNQLFRTQYLFCLALNCQLKCVVLLENIIYGTVYILTFIKLETLVLFFLFFSFFSELEQL